MAITKILVPVTGSLDQTNTLDVAVAVGRVLHSQVEVLYIEIDPEAVGTTGYESNTIGWIYANRESLPQLLNATRDAARAAFHAWAERSEIKLMPPKGYPGNNSPVHWTECVGVPELVIADLGRFCDLIVLSRPDSTDKERRMIQLQAALFEAARPVLLTPPDRLKQFRQDVLVGWNASPGAFRALAAALPLLSCMHRVVLLTIGPTEPAQPARDKELLEYLARHGVRSERMTVPPDQRGVGARLLHEATIIDAGLLVIGAYGHSPIREGFFGSTTRDVLETAERPVFVAH
jgi:nucleotide-binding universal stress UspA family protein